MVFTGCAKDAARVENSLQALSIQLLKTTSQSQNRVLLKWLSFRNHVDSNMSQSSKVWVQLNDIVLSNSDRDIVISEEKLSDLHSNYAQGLLKSQFPLLNRLKRTLCQLNSRATQRGMGKRNQTLIHPVSMTIG